MESVRGPRPGFAQAPITGATMMQIYKLFLELQRSGARIAPGHNKCCYDFECVRAVRFIATSSKFDLFASESPSLGSMTDKSVV